VRCVTKLLFIIDFGREGTISQEDIEYYRDFYDVIIVDEAHHFRHSHRTRAIKLKELTQNKKTFLLTATPINNSLVDLYNLINFFAQDNLRHFSPLGIQNLRLHFTRAEQMMKKSEEAEKSSDLVMQAADFLRTDTLLQAVLIQRSRKFVMESEAMEANAPVFPKRLPPIVIDYSLNKVYAGIFEDIKLAFEKENPLLSLAIYQTESYKKIQDNKDEKTLVYQSGVIGLIRTLLLKRLESSYVSFQASIEDLLRKMGAFVEVNAPSNWATWKQKHVTLWTNTLLHWETRQKGMDENPEDEEENDAPPPPPPLDPEIYNVAPIVQLTLEDMTQLVNILTKVYQKLSPKTDDKLAQLVTRLNSPELSGKKLIIFTEFRDTAQYLYRELKAEFPSRVIEELDSTRQIDREKVIKRFAPYYNCHIDELNSYVNNQIDLLITTDVLSEGINLQDCGYLLNYDIHWNPVRLMQRMGRVDRRVDLTKPIYHPEVHIYNFLPPAELDSILNLLRRVSGKILRINRTLGIEAAILRPEDDTEAALKNFNEAYEQQESSVELLELEMQRIEKEHPEVYQELGDLPKRLFSGKKNAGTTPGLFAAYRFPTKEEGETGEIRWYFRAAETGEIQEGVSAIASLIQCEKETPRVTNAGQETLKEWRQEIEKQRVNRHLRNMQALAGTKATLICWMEIA
jgi:hypothetical protein